MPLQNLQKLHHFSSWSCQALTDGPRDAALADRDQMALPGAPAQPALGDAGEKKGNEVKRREAPQTLQKAQLRNMV